MEAATMTAEQKQSQADHLIGVQRMFGVPAAYQGKSFRNFDDSRYQILNRLSALAQERCNLVICSQVTGIGKTHLGVGYQLLSWSHDRDQDSFQSSYLGHDVFRPRSPKAYIFTSCWTLADEIRTAGVKYQEYMNRIVGPGRRSILIDDVGREDSRNRRHIESVIAQAHANGMQIIITSNFTTAAFYNTYDPAVVRRIRERGGQIINLEPK